MAKIKNWSLLHEGQTLGATKLVGLEYEAANANFTKRMEKDIAAYMIAQEKSTVADLAPRRRRAPGKSNPDWAYDNWKDNHMTV
jgi:hypothetical protein